jgi:hypothetical protein
MDVYVSAEALLYLRAQALEAPRRLPSGLLLGHKRGPRFIVEKVYPSPAAFSIGEREYRAWDRLFAGRIIGFYSAGVRKAAQLLRPFACGKLYLRVDPGPARTPTLKPYVIDYKDRFRLVPVALVPPPKRSP